MNLTLVSALMKSCLKIGSQSKIQCRETPTNNEVTAETSWEIPTDASNIMSGISVQENIVHEEDSVTSSKY